MISVFNKIFRVVKYLLLIISFVLSLYIINYMYHRLNKNILLSYNVFAPYIIIFVMYCINIVFNQKRVNNSLFYNLTSCLVFALIIFVDYRALYDNYMIAQTRLGYNINFNYFNDFVIPMEIMLYGLIITNVLLILNFKSKESFINKV